MTSDFLITVPENTTDSQLADILKEMLPGILVTKFKYNPVYAKALAEELAPAIVNRARQCSELHLLKDRPNRISLIAPSQKQCDDFEKDLKDVVLIKYGDTSAHQKSMIRTMAGKLWSLVSGDDEHWEKNEPKTASGPGVRG